MEPAFEIRSVAGGKALAAVGDWTVRTVGDLDGRLRAVPDEGPMAIDVSGLGRIDVAGAYLLDRTIRGGSPCGNIDRPITLQGDHATAQRLLEAARAAAKPCSEAEGSHWGLKPLFERVGRGLVGFVQESVDTLAFFGLTIATLVRQLGRPNRIRWVSVVAIMESAGLNALPIVALLTFFVGIVVAFLGARVLGDFGASVFTVELVAFSVMREFGVVITAILLAGRTDSAFTAEIGAMKMRQEIDAMRVLGLDPIEALVIPRLLAMLVMMPLLTFAGTMSGLLGGMLVCWADLGVSPVLFISRINESVPQQHFWVGMMKAPFLAVVLALVGCRHGLETGSDVTSLGKRTTASVVQAIFLVIVIDALFAIWFLEMDW
jgi:phospholipid/cholesterol/gamma-HCH transport system permease protein